MPTLVRLCRRNLALGARFGPARALHTFVPGGAKDGERIVEDGGLQYVDLKVGDGEGVEAGDKVELHYT